MLSLTTENKCSLPGQICNRARLPFANVDGDDVHGVLGALGEVAETGHQVRVVIDDGGLDVQVGGLWRRPSGNW